MKKCLSCASRSSAEMEAAARDRKAQQQLDRDAESFRSTVRLLMLGAGESGKSTVVKQMQVLHGVGFSPAERLQRREVIRRNVRDSMLVITASMSRIDPPVPLADPDNQRRVDYIQSEAMRDRDFEPTDLFYDCVAELWRDAGVQACFMRSNEYQLTDGSQYFLDRVAEIRQSNYLPTDEDIVRCRVITSGILETRFCINRVTFHIFDAGGQRGQRNRWIQCFIGVTAIIFVTETSSYDMVLREDPTKNRIEESLELFSTLWNNRWLKTTSILLFLNKQDILAEKVRSCRSPIENYFPAYREYTSKLVRPGTKDAELLRAQHFFKDKFMKIVADYAKDHGEGEHWCYPHFTCAVDKENMRTVFSDCRDIISRINIEAQML